MIRCRLRGHDAGWIAVVRDGDLDSFEWGCRRCGRILPRPEVSIAAVPPREARSVELRRDLYDATAAGVAEVVGELDGEPVFSLTPAGVDHVRRILDAALERGELAPLVLAEAIDIPVPLAADVLAVRLKERRLA